MKASGKNDQKLGKKEQHFELFQSMDSYIQIFPDAPMIYLRGDEVYTSLEGS